MRVHLNRTPVEWSGANDAFTISDDEIRATHGLHCADVDDVVRYGGDVSRYALSCCPIKHDRAYVVVDVKVHMLMRGMWPAIPGWHTDGVPRSHDGSPMGDLPPDLSRQEGLRSPRYHLVVFGGANSQTRFVRDRDVVLDLPAGVDLYAAMTRQVSTREDLTFYDCPVDQVATWDWWEIHSATEARANGWRYLMRVTETDHLAPKKDLRDVIRTQQMAYMTSPEFGW